jgi:hypothetical protein
MKLTWKQLEKLSKERRLWEKYKQGLTNIIIERNLKNKS